VFDACEAMDIPVVFMDQNVSRHFRMGPKMAAVDTPERRRILPIAHKLAEFGHHRIALVGPHRFIGFTIGAYLDQAVKFGFDLAEELVISCEEIGLHEVEAVARHTMDQVLALSERPTAIIVLEICLGTLTTAIVQELRSRGIKVGKEISVVGTEVRVLTARGSEALPTGMYYSPFEKGAVAAEAMLALADGEAGGPRLINVEGQWIDGNSLAPAPGNAPKRRMAAEGGLPKILAEQCAAGVITGKKRKNGE